MLARADAVECRAVKARPNSNAEVKHASTTLKDCLSALCSASPELLADPRTDHSVYALDPLQVPELMVGRGLLTWLMSELGRVVGVIREDYVDGEEMEVLEVRLSLTPTVAVSRAQHATSLQNISNSHSTSANPSPPSTPLTQPTVPQPTRTSVRLRVRSKKESSVTPPPPVQPAKRGRPKKVVPPPPPPEPEIQPVSPGPSRSHSRVSSISSLALSQAQAPLASVPSHPRPSSSTVDSIPPLSRTEPQAPSPTKTLARLLASSNSSSDPSSGTPLLDSLLERLKASGYLSTPQATASGITGQSVDSPDAQRQALLSLLKMASSNTNPVKNPPSTAPTPAVNGFAAPSPRNFTAPSPVSIVSAPSPMTSTTAAPPSSSSLPGPSSVTLGVRKRETDDGEIVEVDPSETKRARVGVGDGKLTGDITAPSPSVSATSPPTSVLSPNQSVASPNLSLASPNMSVASPNMAALSPSISGAASSAPSPNLATPSPAVSPAISAASPYPYPQPLGPPRTLTTTVSQPNLTFSHPPLQATSSQPTLPSSISQAKRRRQATQTDLPPCTGSFITPRSQIGQPRPAPVEPISASAPPRVPQPTTLAPVLAPPARKPTTATRAKHPNGREMSEKEVREMLAGGYYPSGGLQDEHRRLFGAAGRGKKDTDRGSPSAPPPPPPAPPPPPPPAPELPSTSAAPPPKPRTRAPRPREPRPTIPKHSPVAPPVSRLPMMMTSPIRATGVSSNSLPPSFSPLKRLLKNAGVKSIEEVLSKGGVLGLKDEMKREEKREKEIVDLTSDADDDDDPPLPRPPRTPARSPKPLEAPPTTPPRRSVPFKPSTPPRKAHTSPPTARASESPLFKGSADVPLPPSSPPPMSDSDVDGSVKGGNRTGYTSEGGGYSSETGGYDAGISSDAPPDPDVEMSDTDDEAWDETIRPVERDEGGSGHVGSVLGQMEFGLQTGFGHGVREPQAELQSLSSLLDMLESQGVPSSDAASSEVELDLSGLDQQTLDLANVGIDLANTGLDFSWLETIGQGAEGMGGMGMEGLIQGDGAEPGNIGMEFDPNSLVVGETVMDGQVPAMSEADLAQLLAAFGPS
ncbi:hypothetical protein RSOL_407640 [Rhizoctonia solani AG-3 Rhs1AP]|uniref:Ams2/SPT21 N-terminal domain-containing protein n=1 Tax=Rhizoctonia solani AG-3 Rhs1AP TaxID=1086054 RepID=X8JCV2_9AGAM|nr:hypothetical protein RSOL_407640 [Rhizoctonia solani AG-3 Rhs1AP]